MLGIVGAGTTSTHMTDKYETDILRILVAHILGIHERYKTPNKVVHI